MVSYFTIYYYGRLLRRFSSYRDFARFIDVLTVGKGFWVALERRL